jgi:hypothetical protein
MLAEEAIQLVERDQVHAVIQVDMSGLTVTVDARHGTPCLWLLIAPTVFEQPRFVITKDRHSCGPD